MGRWPCSCTACGGAQRPILAALEAKGIRRSAAAARAYFEIAEVRDLVACFAVLLAGTATDAGRSARRRELATYVDNVIVQLGRRFGARILWPLPCNGGPARSRPFRKAKRSTCARPTTSITCSRSTHSRARSATRTPRATLRSSPSSSTSFRATTTTRSSRHGNRELLRLPLLQQLPAPALRTAASTNTRTLISLSRRATSQVMTIHQAKGLEFPVVVVGSLSNQLSSPKQTDRDLRAFYHRPPFEPESRITLFDRMRLHYVAFSRPQKVLVLTAHEAPRTTSALSGRGSRNGPTSRRNYSPRSASTCTSACP